MVTKLIKRHMKKLKKTTKTTKTTSADRLKNFLSDEYIKKGGAGNFGTSIRDCLTDLIHINNQLMGHLDFHQIVKTATEVYNEEKEIADDKAQCKDY